MICLSVLTIVKYSFLTSFRSDISGFFFDKTYKDLSDNDQFFYEFRLVYQNPTGIVGGNPEFSKKYSCKISKLIETSAAIGGASVVVGPASEDTETQEVEVTD